MGTTVVDALAALGRGRAGAEAADAALSPYGARTSLPCPPRGGVPAPRRGPCDEPVVLADRPDGTVVRTGSVVSKAHAAGTDTAALRARLRVAAHPRLRGVLLPPLPLGEDGALLGVLPDGRAASLWPAGRPVSPDDPDAAPWEESAALLARLHAVPPGALPGPLPRMRGPAKAARAVARLRATTGVTAPPATAAAARTVLAAWAGLPPWARGEIASPDRGAHRAVIGELPARGEAAHALCHGDLHLGQLVRHPAPDGPWRLIDVDDLGLGEPAWDLARPAAWYAAGLLAPDAWARFLGAYRAEGGTAVCPEGDPWGELDVPARALTVQSAALALVKAAGEGRAPDEVEEALFDACARMARVPVGHRAPNRPPGV